MKGPFVDESHFFEKMFHFLLFKLSDDFFKG